MADEADFAANETDRWLQQSIHAQRNQPRGLVPRGSCHNCDEVFTLAANGPLFDKLLYCDESCRGDHELRQKLKNR